MDENRVELLLSETGVVIATVPASVARGEPGGAAVLLDGVLHATVPLITRRRGPVRFSVPLPSHALPATLDVVSVATGRSLLAQGFDLVRAVPAAAEIAQVSQARIAGTLTAPAWLGTHLLVELLDGPAVRGRGIATRPAGETAIWCFAVPLDCLVPLGKSVSLRLRVGGRLLGPVLMVGPRDVGLVGFLDQVSGAAAEGWVLDLGDPARRVALDLVIDGVVTETMLADRPRPDISGAGFGDGHCGFSAQIPPPQNPFVTHSLALRIAGTPTHVCNSPVGIPAVEPVIGCLDRLHGASAHGWAFDRSDPAATVLVEILGPDGAVLTTARADQFRGDLLEAGLGDGMCAFRIDLTPWLDILMNRDVTVRTTPSAVVLAGSPLRLAPNPNIARFLRRRQGLAAPALARLRRMMAYRSAGEGISIIMAVHNTAKLWLIEALESVRTQWCDGWELIVVDDGSTEPHVAEVLSAYARKDRRIRVLTSRENVGISRAVNFGLRAVRHSHVAFMDHDDYLEPDAVWQLLRAARASHADLMYSDEVLTGEALLSLIEFRMRPAFSHDYYLSHPYFVHMVCVRTEIARRLGGYDEAMTISADVDFVLRAIEQSDAIAHIPAVLYRWRTHGGSTGHAKQDAVTETTVAALQRHLDRLGTGARAAPGCWFNQYRIDWPEAAGRVLVVIPTRNKVHLLREAIASIERTAPMEALRIVVIDHESDEPATREYLAGIAGRHVVMPYAGAFNFSAMNNAAVALHGEGCAFVLFLNNDVEAIEPGWIERLRSLAARPEIGAVGPMLLYGDRRVQHAGVILGFNDSAEHALKFEPAWLEKGRRNLGYNCALSSVRDYSAVTAACMMMRREVFDAVGGFDESFGVGFNDTDLCLRVRAGGWRVLYDGATMLYHHESATRSETRQVLHPEDTHRLVDRWAGLLRMGDPFYHPNLSLLTRDHVPREDAGCAIWHAPRVVRPAWARAALSAAAD